MRNLKRALSLVLAIVMLAGMMMIPTNAASTFADADEIVNKEAVAITAGMGLFAGSDGKFNPKGTVTRAQMATIIVKMVYGSEFNADSFKGAANPFTDTASFESGWAEGYINACYQMGIVKGYGDGTFKPGNAVTTAEAVTMIINALKVDAGQGEWPLTVMAKAAEMKLFGDLKPAPATNEALIRDQLAVITLEGLQYSPAGASGYKVEGVSIVFDNMGDALKAAGYDPTKISEVVGQDTLAGDVYNLGVASGFVTDNKATGVEYTKVGEEDYDIETGLDMIGHYVTVYYKVPAAGKYVDAYETYAIVDESAAYVVEEDAASSKEYKAVFGRNYDLANGIKVFDGGYNEIGGTVDNYVAGQNAPAGTYIISENKVVAYLAPAVVTATYIASINDFGDEVTYMLGGMASTIAEEDITVYAGAAKGDYVTVVQAKGQYVLSPVDPVKGTISKTTVVDGKDVLTVNGADYTAFGAENNFTSGSEHLTIAVDTSRFEYGEQYTVYITQDNKVVGWRLTSGGSGEVDVDNVYYVKGAFSKTEKDKYGVETTKYYLQAVGTKGEEEHLLMAISGSKDLPGSYTTAADYTEGFYVVEEYTDENAALNKEYKKEGIKTATRIGLRSDADNDTGLFIGANRWSGSSIKMPASYSNNHICTSACTALGGGSKYHSFSDNTDSDKNTSRTFFGGDTAFLMIKGDAGEALKCAAGGDGFSYTLSSVSNFTLPMVFTEDDNGLVDVVMVVIPKDPADLSASYPATYVVAGDKIGTDANGDVYKAYRSSSAEAVEIVVRPGTVLPYTGFISYTIDEDGYYIIDGKSASDNAYEGMVLTGVTGSGILNAIDPLYDGKDRMQSPAGTNASSAKIVDLRSEEEIKALGVGKITNLEQLRTLIENQYVITFDSWSNTGSTSKTYAMYIKSVSKNPTEMVYVLNASEAGVPTAAYSVTTGQATTVTVNEDSDVVGFATLESDKSKLTLTAAEGAEYRMNEIVESFSDDYVFTSTNGKTVKITENTVIASMIGAVADRAALKAKFDALTGNATFTISCIGADGGEASFLIVTGQGDPYIATGDMIVVSDVLTAGQAGSAAGTMLSGLKAGEAHEIAYENVIVPEGVTGIADTDTIYYTVDKNSDGEVTLTFAYNYKPVAKDMFYAIDKVTKGELTQMYVLGSATAKDGTLVWMIPTGGSGYNSGVEHFWVATSDTAMTDVIGAWGNSTAKYRFAYHDVISKIESTKITLADDHVEYNNCPYSTKYTGGGYSGVGTFSGNSCSTNGGRSTAYESGTSQSYAASDLVIVDRRSSVLAGTADPVTTIAEVKALTDNGEAIVNVYSNATSKSNGTATFIAVIDPKPNFVPPVPVTVTAVNGSATADKAKASAGDTITLNIVADPGYELDTITVNGAEVETTVFVAPADADAYDVVVTFKAIPQYTISVGTVANGTVTVTPSGTVYRDVEIEVEAVPAMGYKLVEILVNGVPIADDMFVVTGDAVVTATFELDTTMYTVTVGTVENGSVTVAPETGLAGTEVTVTATAATGYALDKIYVDGDAIDGNKFNISGNNVVTATFAKLFTVTDVTTAGGTLTFSKNEAKAGETVTVTGVADETAYSLVAIEVNGVKQETFSITVEEDCQVEGIFAYAPKADEVYFVPGQVKAGQIIDGYVLTSDDVSTGTLVDLYMPKGTGVDYSTGRFWKVNASGTPVAIKGVTVTSADGGNGDSKFGYHDAINKVNTETGLVILQDGMQHRGAYTNDDAAKACCLGFSESCGTSGYASEMGARQLGPYVNFVAGTSVIIDLRAGVTDKIDTLAELATLATGKSNQGGLEGDPIVNTYSADAVYTTKANYKTVAGTITAIIIVDG